MLHIVGYASDFVKLEERFQAGRELSWARETERDTERERKTKISGEGCPKPVFMLGVAYWIIICVVLETQVQELK